MNMSQNSTYDTFNDNKSTLQNALKSSFNQSDANISLDLGMQNDSSNQEFERQRQEQENRQIVQSQNGQNRIGSDIQTEQIVLDNTQSYM
jgi:hypothetical protein